MKPIRYWIPQKVYKWGCPECDYNTWMWESFFMHCKDIHNTIHGSFHDPVDNYTLKRLK